MSGIAWHDLRAPELRALAEADAMVIVPVGSTEQHGPHLPVQVDARAPRGEARRNDPGGRPARGRFLATASERGARHSGPRKSPRRAAPTRGQNAHDGFPLRG